MSNKFLTFAIVSLSIIMAASLSLSRDKASIPSQQSSTLSESNKTEIVAKLITAATQVDRINILGKNSGFVFDFLNPPSGTTEISGRGGHIVAANRKNFPAVVGTGLSMNAAFVEPCGLNTPHLHPRASELFFAINGTFETGFVAENDVRIVRNTVYGGQVTVFPQGAMHYQANLGCERVVFIAAFSNEDAGISLVAQNFFRISEDVLSATLGGVSTGAINYLSSIIPDDLASGLQSCRKECGLDKSN